MEEHVKKFLKEMGIDGDKLRKQEYWNHGGCNEFYEFSAKNGHMNISFDFGETYITYVKHFYCPERKIAHYLNTLEELCSGDEDLSLTIFQNDVRLSTKINKEKNTGYWNILVDEMSEYLAISTRF